MAKLLYIHMLGYVSVFFELNKRLMDVYEANKVTVYYFPLSL